MPSLMPTPVCPAPHDSQHSAGMIRARRDSYGPELTTIFDAGTGALLQTPSAADGGGGHESRGGDRSGELLLNGQVKSLLPTPMAQQSGNTPEGHLAKKPGRKVVTDLAILAENGLLESGGRLLPTPEAKLSDSGPDYARASRAGSGGHDLTTAVALMPTPTTGLGKDPDVANQMATRNSPGLDSITGLLGMPEETWNRTDPARMRKDSRGAELRAQAGKPPAKPVQETLFPDLDAAPAPDQTFPTPTVLDNVEKRTTHAGGGLTLQGVVGGVNPKDAARMDRRGVDVQEWRALPTPRATDGEKGGPNQRGSSGDLMLPSAAAQMATDAGIQWGDYEPAIRRWEAIMGPAPAPTEPTKKGTHRLSARFTEWMMGQPPGWITDPGIGISRNDQLKACGNGVVTQQAVAALQDMLAVAA